MFVTHKIRNKNTTWRRTGRLNSCHFVSLIKVFVFELYMSLMGQSRTLKLNALPSLLRED